MSRNRNMSDDGDKCLKATILSYSRLLSPVSCSYPEPQVPLPVDPLRYAVARLGHIKKHDVGASHRLNNITMTI